MRVTILGRFLRIGIIDCRINALLVSASVETSFNDFIPLKGNFHHVTCHEGTEGKKRYSFTLSLTLALDRGG